MRRKNIEHFDLESTVQEELLKILEEHGIKSNELQNLVNALRMWELESFIDGYITALQHTRSYSPALCLEGSDLRNYILGEIVLQNKKQSSDQNAKSRAILSFFNISDKDIDEMRDVNGRAYDATRILQMASFDHPYHTATVLQMASESQSSNALLWQPKFDKAKFRAMIFDCEAVDDDGHEIDPITCFSASKHRPWKHTIKDGSRIIRYIDIPCKNDTPLRVRIDDIETMSKLIWNDIMTGDTPIIRRYVSHAKNPASELHVFSATIGEAIKDLIHDCPACDNSELYAMLAELK